MSESRPISRTWMPDDLPTGTVTFLFSDIEGSTKLLEQIGTDYAPALSAHRDLIRSAVRAHGGTEVSAEGDEFFAAFPSAHGAIDAAAEAQRAISAHSWPADSTLRVRMGLHTGIGATNDGGYVGLDVHRAARIMAAAHGGQVLVSQSTRALANDGLSPGLAFRDLGGHRLKDFPKGDHLFQLSVDGLPTDFPHPRTVDAVSGNLPSELAPIVGRTREIRDILRLVLEGRRLVTITGPGGIGKSRLAVEVAGRARDRFPDGLWFVPLASISDDELVPTAVASTLGVQLGPRQDPLDTIADHLAGTRSLLVLDNVEQVQQGAARTAMRLLGDTSRSQVLATGRMAFHIHGEREVPLQPLAFPGLDSAITPATIRKYEGTALFAQLAAEARPGFRLTEADADTAARIVARLDGLPLAIELAAARVRLLTLTEILHGLDSPLRLLAGGPVDLPERQQTMRAAIGWSHDLLDAATQDLFARFGVFVGGWTAGDAEAVCVPNGSGDVLGPLGTLVDHSLVRRSDSGETTRFTMLETIRAFAGERLDALPDAEGTRRRHAARYLDLAESLAPVLSSSTARAVLDTLDREHDNIRAALGWAIETRDAATALRFVTALWRFWYMRGHLLEARSRIGAVLELPDLDAHPRALAAALGAAGSVFYWLADVARAEQLYEQSLALHRDLGDRRATAAALYDLSFVVGAVRRAGDGDKRAVEPAEASRTPEESERAMQLLEESRSISRELSDLEGEARATFGLANLAATLDHLSSTRDLAGEAVALFRQAGDDHGLTWALHLRAIGATESGRIDLARASLDEGLPLVREIGDLTGILFYLDGFALVAQERGALDRAMRISGAAEALARTLGIPEGRAGVAFLGNRTARKALLADPVLAAAWASGEAMTPEEAMTYAVEPDDA